jgi:hypothetical protein
MATARAHAFKHAAVVFARWYLALAAVSVLIRVAVSFFGAPAWVIGSMPWPEVFYGPAIAVAAMFGAPWLGAKVEAWLRAREN